MILIVESCNIVIILCKLLSWFSDTLHVGPFPSLFAALIKMWHKHLPSCSGIAPLPLSVPPQAHHRCLPLTSSLAPCVHIGIATTKGKCLISHSLSFSHPPLWVLGGIFFRGLIFPTLLPAIQVADSFERWQVKQSSVSSASVSSSYL